MLKTRVASAVILLPLVLVSFIYGPAWFVRALIFVCLSFCVFECATFLIPAFESRLTSLPTKGKKSVLFVVFTVVLAWALFFVMSNGLRQSGEVLTVFVLFFALLAGIFFSNRVDLGVARGFSMIVSLVYGVLPWLAVWDLYLMGDHARYILLIMAVTWSGDTGGYFVGRFFGNKFIKSKLSPHISPKKTWEGSIGGLFLSIFAAMIIYLCFKDRSLMVYAACGLFGGMGGQVGDLVESAIKRFSGVKDSGVIIPGHGGFLDRVDGLLFSAPIIWFILQFMS